MVDHDITPACLSAEDHDGAVSNPLLHYLGCLEFSKRETYLCKEVRREQKKLIESELRRIGYLRHVLEKDEVESKLIRNLKDSIKGWKNGEEFKGPHGITAVQRWRAGSNLPNGIAQRREAQLDPNKKAKSYDPDYDMNAYLARFEDSRPVEDLNDSRFRGHFPNHKIPTQLLLSYDEVPNPLTNPISATKASPESIINYFHLPANNMIWIEKAIARYFGEKDLDYDKVFREPTEDKRTEAYMLLRPQFWKGQQHGGKSAEVHARHMRPLCEMVSSDPKEVDTSPRNVVLFMPYLHWETDRQRDKIAQFLDKEAEKHRKGKESRELEQKVKRQRVRGDLFIPEQNKLGKDVVWAQPTDNKDDDQGLQGVPRTATSSLLTKVLLYPRFRRHLESRLIRTKDGRVCAGTEVGQVLFDAAMLYEAMTIYRDKMFIRKYLHEDPPLHPRRTLDQAYYWTLKTTRSRDRDQVVYRGTRPTPERAIKPGTNRRKPWECPHQLSQPAENLDQESPRQKKKTAEVPKPNGDHCIHCRSQIRQVSRLLMVDQLWMWILDEKTIITSFPKRYGVNKQDLSGVHRSIRSRFKSLRRGHVNTVFDLALIILDECSNTFFDRTKTADRQPQVLDIFSQAIGNINNKQTISFHHLWDWTDKLGRLAGNSSNIITDMSSFVAPLLNISTEGELQREIKDVIDELDIMIYINNQQLEVMKKFAKDVGDLLNPDGDGRRFNASSPPTSPTASSAEKREAKHTKRSSNYSWFRRTAQELLDDVEDRIKELNGLKQSAESTSKSLEDLLSLKQQQASVVQAWQSVQQAEEATRQGRAILIFTVITIVFLPLGFMAGIFGMNNADVSEQGNMTIGRQFKLMFGISAGVIFVVLVFAYSNFVRTLFWLAYRYLVTLMLVKTPAYDRLYLSLDWKSSELTSKVEKEVTEMKAKAKKTKQIRTAKKLNDEIARELEKKKKAEEEKEKKKANSNERPPEDQHDGTAGQGQPAQTGAVPPSHAGVPDRSPRASSTHANTAPERQPSDLEAGKSHSIRRRMAQFLRPQMVSEGAQTSVSLLEEGKV